MKIVLGIAGVALVATLGDYTWYMLHVRHSIITGIIHGAVPADRGRRGVVMPFVD